MDRLLNNRDGRIDRAQPSKLMLRASGSACDSAGQPSQGWICDWRLSDPVILKPDIKVTFP